MPVSESFISSRVNEMVGVHTENKKYEESQEKNKMKNWFFKLNHTMLFSVQTSQCTSQCSTLTVDLKTSKRGTEAHSAGSHVTSEMREWRPLRFTRVDGYDCCHESSEALQWGDTAHAFQTPVEQAKEKLETQHLQLLSPQFCTKCLLLSGVFLVDYFLASSIKPLFNSKLTFSHEM